jgi:hypothetical protein
VLCQLLTVVPRAPTQVSTARLSVYVAVFLQPAPAMALKAAKKQLAVPGVTCPAMKKNGRLPTPFEQRLYRVRSLQMYSARDYSRMASGCSSVEACCIAAQA